MVHPRQQLAVELPKFGDTDTLPAQTMQPISPAQAEANKDKKRFGQHFVGKSKWPGLRRGLPSRVDQFLPCLPAIPGDQGPRDLQGRTRRGAKLLPLITVTDIGLYSCKPEDKSFVDLSNRHYGSDKYAQALLKFNRDGYGVAPGILLDPPPLLEAGMVVQIPPMSKLEVNYPDLIPGLKSLTAVPSLPNAPPPPPGLLPDSVPLTNANVPMTPVPPANVQARPGE